MKVVQKYDHTRDMAYDFRDAIDQFILKDIDRSVLVKYIKDTLSFETNRRKIYKVKGYASTIVTVLGKERMPVFEEILNEINSNKG